MKSPSQCMPFHYHANSIHSVKSHRPSRRRRKHIHDSRRVRSDIRKGKDLQVDEQKMVDLPVNLEKRHIAELRSCDLDDIGAIFSQSPSYCWPSNDSTHLDHPDSR